MRRTPHRAHNIPRQPVMLLSVSENDVMSNDTSQIKGPVFIGTISPFHFVPKKVEVLEYLFHKHVEKWKNDTQHWSSVTKMIAHPSYLRIIGLASESLEHEIERWLLRELKDDPDYWFDALTALVGDQENPVQPQDDFDGAVNAWLEWGRKKGYVVS
jgi:hypothetical protein